MKYFRQIEIGDAVQEGDVDESGRPVLREIRLNGIPEYYSATGTIAERSRKVSTPRLAEDEK